MGHHKLGLNKITLKYAVKIGEIYMMYSMSWMDHLKTFENEKPDLG